MNNKMQQNARDTWRHMSARVNTDERVFPETSRRHAPLVPSHRIGWEDNKQTTETMDPIELRGNKSV